MNFVSDLSPATLICGSSSLAARLISQHGQQHCRYGGGSQGRLVRLEGREGETGEREEPTTEKAKQKISVNDLRTAPMDFRFPATNQAKHCYTAYNEYHKCIADWGESAKECQKYARYYRSLCPGEWVEKWNEERDNGTFPGRY